MSWDIMLMETPEGITCVADLANGFAPQALGPKSSVLEAIKLAVPGVDLTNPSWGRLDGPTWSIELNLGEEDPVDSILLHVYSEGDLRGEGDVLEPVFAIAGAVGCRPLDCSSGVVLEPGDTDSWHAFQRFRDQALGNGT